MKSIVIKIVITNILLASIFGIFTGCNSRKGNFDDIGIKNNELSHVELTFYMPGTERRDTKEVLDKVAENTKLNINLTFKWFNESQYVAKIKTAIASNESFDAFLCGRPETGSLNFVDMLRNGEIRDVSALLPIYAPIIYKELSTNQQLDCIKVDGKLALIPSLCPEAKCLVVTVKEEYINKYNVQPIKTFEDYGDLMKIIKNYNKDMVPGSIGTYNLQTFAGSFGYTILDYSQNLVYKNNDTILKVIPWEQTPEFKKTVALISEWYKNGYIKPGNTNISQVESFLYNTGSFVLGSIDLNVNQDGNIVRYNNYLLYENNKIQRDNPIGNMYVSGAIAFTSSSKNTERVLMLLNWIQSNQENYDLFMYGIKDKDYILKGERYALPDGVNLNNSPYIGWNNTAFININLQRLPVANSLPDSYKKDHVEFINMKSSYAPSEGFYPNYSKIQDECNSRMNIYKNKITNKLSNATYDISETDNIIMELKNGGTNVVVNEIQKQLDEWLSKQKK